MMTKWSAYFSQILSFSSFMASSSVQACFRSLTHRSFKVSTPPFPSHSSVPVTEPTLGSVISRSARHSPTPHQEELVEYHILDYHTKVFLYEYQTDNSYDTVDYLLTRTLSYTRRFVGAPTHGEAAAALASKLSRANLVQSERRTEGFTQTGRRRLCWTSSGCRDAPRGGAK